MNIFKSLITVAMFACCVIMSSMASAGQGQLLSLPLGYPLVDTDAVGGTCSYDTGSSALTLTANATIVTFDAAGTNIGFITSGTMTLSANIDSTGTLTGGSFVLAGDTMDFNTSESFPSPLLTGVVTDYGIDMPGTTDKADFRVAPTGGSLLSRYPVGDNIAVSVVLEGSTYNGSFASNWGCTRPKSSIGPTPPAVQESCNLTLTKTANPTSIGPIVVAPGHDDPNDSDDSDSKDHWHDGYHDSNKTWHAGYNDIQGSWCDGYHDSDGTALTCGCEGKVSELTLQYNGSQPADVMVTRKAPFSVVLYQGTVQPGGQFTVVGSDFGPNGFKGTLGTAIQIAIDGGDTVEMHTSCSKPIGPGLTAGNFTVISGKSRKLNVPLCTLGNGSCPANQQVTYTYTLTNNGSQLSNVVLDDDKLGNIDTISFLDAGGTVTRTKQTCLSQTTTNTATAMGILPSGSHCAATPATATVNLIITPPPPPPGCTGDSDDCDDDGDNAPPPTGEHHNGCSTKYWKDDAHKKQWKMFKSGDRFGAVCKVDSGGNRKLIDTLDVHGGGSKALGRQAVAALLNATNPNVNYYYSASEVKAMVQNAYATKDFTTPTGLLKKYNNMGCPLP